MAQARRSCITVVFNPYQIWFAFATAGDEIRFLQHREMVRYRRLGPVELFGQRSCGHFTLTKEVEDLATGI
jgi:hypothetical protein